MLIKSEILTKEEFCNVTHTDPNSKLFDLLGNTAFFMRMPYDSNDSRIWYHCGSHEDDNQYYGNFEIHEEEHEVWVDFNKKIAAEFDLKPRNYGLWFLWSKY